MLSLTFSRDTLQNISRQSCFRIILSFKDTWNNLGRKLVRFSFWEDEKYNSNCSSISLCNSRSIRVWDRTKNRRKGRNWFTYSFCGQKKLSVVGYLADFEGNCLTDQPCGVSSYCLSYLDRLPRAACNFFPLLFFLSLCSLSLLIFPSSMLTVVWIAWTVNITFFVIL